MNRPAKTWIEKQTDALTAAYLDRHNFACPYAWAQAHPIIDRLAGTNEQKDHDEDRNGDFR